MIKDLIKISLQFIGLLLLAASFSSCDAKKEMATTSSDSGGFLSLFNGKDLNGWTPAKENPDSFSVKDGILVVKGGRSHLFYTGKVNGGKFKNFELRLKVKTFPGSNSGVYFHTAYQDQGWPEKGYECQVNSTHKDPKKTGSLYGVKNILVLAEGQKEPPGDNIRRDKSPSSDGEWFDYDITVKDRNIHIKVNGETTVDYNEPEGGPKTNFTGRRLSEGTFAIQAHDPNSETHYREIQVKVLD